MNHRLSLSIAALATLAFGCGGSEKPATLESSPVVNPEPGPAPEAVVAETPAAEPPKLRLGDSVVPRVDAGYQVALDLDPARADFSGTVDIAVEVREPVTTVWLNAVDLTVSEATITAGGRSVPARAEVVKDHPLIGLSVDEPLAVGNATIHIAYSGKVSDKDLGGIFTQVQDGHKYLYTQFEPIDARRAFPSFDEPSFKVPWQLSLTVPEDMVAVSNTAVATEKKIDGGKKLLTFEKTKPLPSYLVAFAVGPFDIVDIGTAGKNKTHLRVIVPKGDAAKTAYVKKSIPALLSLLENYYGSGYPYPKLDTIAIPHFFGAMENAGAITYASSIILRDPKDMTISFRRRSANIVAHEMAHQWTGDLVTMSWWNDLWLNEAFATWMAAKTVSTWKPEWHGDIKAVSTRERALMADSLLSARKIRQPITTENDIHSAFDAITYEKGASIIAMFESYVGEENFQKGVRNYLAAHAWKNATSEDFLGAIAAVAGDTGKETMSAFSTFLNQPGEPIVSVALSCTDGHKPSLSLSQKRYLPVGSSGSTDSTWGIPVCVEYGSGKSHDTACTLMTEKTATLTLDKAKTCPTWVLANANAAGYYRVAHQPDMLAKLAVDKKHHLTIAERLNVLSNVEAAVHSDVMPLDKVLSLVPELAREKNPFILGEALSIASVHDGMIDDDLKDEYAGFVRKNFSRLARRIGWKPRRKDDDQVKLLRPELLQFDGVRGHDMRVARAATKLAHKWLKNHDAVDASVAGTALSMAAYYGDEKLYNEYLAAAKAEKEPRDRRMLIGALTGFRNLDLLKKNFQMFLDGTFEIHESFWLLLTPDAFPEGDKLRHDFVTANIDAVAAKVPRWYRARVINVAVGKCSVEQRDAIKTFFAKRAQDYAGGPRALAQMVEHLDLCIAYKHAQKESLESFLNKL